MIAPSLVPNDQGAPQSAGQSPKAKVKPPSPDERIADYTLWLERFTGALAIVSSIQIIFLVRADMTASRSASAATEAAKIARMALEGIERPFVVLSIVANEQEERDLGLRAPIRCALTNYGKTPAIVTHLSRIVRAYDHDKSPGAAKVGDVHAIRMDPLVIAAGETTEVFATMARSGMLEKPPSAYHQWFMVGYVRYRGMMGDDYLGGFRAIRTEDDPRFRLVSFGSYDRRAEPGEDELT
jgi:hypothetical protein